MPLSTAALALAATYQLEAYAKGDPVDNVNSDRPFLKAMLAKKKETIGGNDNFNEKVFFSNDSNYQNYEGDEEVDYNRKDTSKLAKYPFYSFHDGFGLNEDELVRNGIVLTDDSGAMPTSAEEVAIIDILKTNFYALREGVQDNLQLELLQDGSQDASAVPGLDSLVALTPTNTVGGISGNTHSWWRNNVNLDISVATAGNLTQEMEETWRACTKYTKTAPDLIVAGAAFVDAYRKDCKDTMERHIVVTGADGVKMDASVTGLFFKGVPIVWVPAFEDLDTLLSPVDDQWTKRAYFINTRHMIFRPIKGHWMVNRRPSRMYNRYVHYFGLTSKYRLTTNCRRAHAVLSLD
jgi:hypothetical protein